MSKTGVLALLFIWLTSIYPTESFSQESNNIYSGTYTMKTEQVELTLHLKEQTDSKISGTLTSTTGINFKLEGEMEGGVATGICSGDEGSVFFEIYKEGKELICGLIEPDQWNMPDYNQATYLSFTKSQKADQTNIPTHMNTASGQANSGDQNLSGDEIGDPSWGFKFTPPAGWTHQQSGEGLIMGHTSIPGIILIFPHMLKTIAEVQQEMHKGIQEEGSYLSLASEISIKPDNVLSGDYQGIMDGQQAKAKGFGTLSPYGGGAFILAVSTPEMLGPEIIRDAESIVTNLVYSKIEVSDLMIHFAGKWANFTTNTSTWIQFNADGTYGEQYESSYSGDFDNNGGNWGAHGSDNSKGRWTVQGNRDNGRIIVVMANGNEIYYEYRVHEENGQKYYAEYWFNGKLYSKSRE